VGKLAELIGSQRADLAAFFRDDPRGRKIPDYLDALAEHLRSEHAEIGRELDGLRKNVEHINDIVAMQQSYARLSGVAETVPVVELVEDALRMNAGAMLRHEVEVVRDFQTEAVVTVDKHKVLQILVNLLRNAKYACDESGRGDKQIRLSIAAGDQRVRIEVRDNGVGIPAENLTKIFSHGFTTRKHGHGFGLHSCALAARELGGSLVAQSDGPGCGALFTLELPYKSEARAA
jgi:C4-dicarboxylate-specific signal transduction histidine kinase